MGKSLKITDVKWWTTAPAGTPLVVVKILTNEPEIYGLGCSTFSWRYTPVVTLIKDYLRPYLIGKDPANITDIWNTLNVNAYWRNGPIQNNALSGVDMALWDIKGRVANMPCYDLWGGKSRAGATVYVHTNGTTKEEVLERVQEYQEKGFTHIRCQLGGYQGLLDGKDVPGKELFSEAAYYDEKEKLYKIPELFEYIRNKAGQAIEVLYDVHERLMPTDAVWLAKALEPYRLFFLEDLLPPEEWEWFRRIREQSAVPIAMGELFSHPNTIKSMVEERLFDFLRIHPSDIGGITPCLKLADVCADKGIRTAWHGPGDLTPIGLTAAVHMDVNKNNFGIQEWAFRTELEHEMFQGIPEIKVNMAVPSDKPGWGIEFDEKLAEKYPAEVKPTTWTLARRADGGMGRP
jgi:mannonate dehydratase